MSDEDEGFAAESERMSSVVSAYGAAMITIRSAIEHVHGVRRVHA